MVKLVEEVQEFDRLLDDLLVNARKLKMRDETIAYILLREGLDYYLKSITSHYLTHQNQNSGD